MAALQITVPAAQADAVRAALLTLYEVQAEALQVACEAHLRERGSSAALRAKRAALLRVDGLVAQAGLELRRPECRPLALEGPAEVVLDALLAALLEAVERLDVASRDLGAGRAAPEDVRSLTADVVAIVDLVVVAGAARG